MRSSVPRSLRWSWSAHPGSMASKGDLSENFPLLFSSADDGGDKSLNYSKSGAVSPNKTRLVLAPRAPRTLFVCRKRRCCGAHAWELHHTEPAPPSSQACLCTALSTLPKPVHMWVGAAMCVTAYTLHSTPSGVAAVTQFPWRCGFCALLSSNQLAGSHAQKKSIKGKPPTDKPSFKGKVRNRRSLVPLRHPQRHSLAWQHKAARSYS